MNKLFFLFFLSISYAFAAQDYWFPRDTVKGSPKSAMSAISLQNIGLIIGGLDAFGFKRKMYSYSPFQDDWNEEVSLGGTSGDGLERGSACAFSLYHENILKAYVCLGQTQTVAYMKDLWEFNPTTEIWSQKANFGGSARRQAVSFTAANIAYVGTGEDATGLKKDFYTYNPATNLWIQIADFSGTARRDALAFELNGYGFIGTGDDGTLKNDLWMYDPQSDNWIDKAAFPGTPRSGAVAWGAFPCAYIATGEDVGGNFTNDLYEYNYYLNAWIQRANLPAAGRKNAFAFYINGVSFVGAGYNGSFLEDFWAYSGTAEIYIMEPFDLILFPNPTQDELCVIAPEEMKEIKVFSMDGKCVLSLQDSSKEVSLNTAEWNLGSYIFQCQIAGQSLSKSFIKCP